MITRSNTIMNNFRVFNDCEIPFPENLTVFHKTKCQILLLQLKSIHLLLPPARKVRTIKIHSRQIISKVPIISQRNELKIKSYAHGTVQIKAGRTPALNLLDFKSSPGPPTSFILRHISGHPFLHPFCFYSLKMCNLVFFMPYFLLRFFPRNTSRLFSGRPRQGFEPGYLDKCDDSPSTGDYKFII